LSSTSEFRVSEEKALSSVKKVFFLAGPVAAFLLAHPALLPAAKIVERIIARVNSEIITQRMFERERGKLRAELAQEYSGTELEAQLREQSKNLLRDLIDQALMVQKAKDLDINVETEVVKRLDGIRKNLNLTSQEDLQHEVEKQGLVWEDFIDNTRRSLLMREVIGREVGGRIILSRQDVRKYFQEHKKEFQSPGGVHLAEILISTEKRKPEEAEPRAKQALAEIKAGARFSDVAKKYSDDATASEGGDVGILKPGTLSPAVAEAVNKLEVNDTSDIVQTSHGYMILKVLERISPGIPTFEEVEQRVNEVLYNQKMQPALRAYLVNLRKESYIYLAPGYVDTGAERPSDAVLAKKGQ
jgi:peptidyl-prolyl cis-trans isomerase SurA